MTDDDRDELELILDDSDYEPWEPMVPAEGEPTLKVCMACWEANVDDDHRCNGTAVVPNEEDGILIEVSFKDIPEFYRRRAKWLNERCLVMKDALETYRAVLQMFYDPEPDVDDGPLLGYHAFGDDTVGEA